MSTFGEVSINLIRKSGFQGHMLLTSEEQASGTDISDGEIARRLKCVAARADMLIARGDFGRLTDVVWFAGLEAVMGDISRSGNFDAYIDAARRVGPVEVPEPGSSVHLTSTTVLDVGDNGEDMEIRFADQPDEFEAPASSVDGVVDARLAVLVNGVA